MKQFIQLFIVLAILIMSSRSFGQEKAAPAEQKKPEMSANTIAELDAFHKLLHPLVHDAYPSKDFAAIKEALPGLIKSANVLKGASLPKSMSDKKKAFRSESKKLVSQLTQLNKKKGTLKDEDFGNKFMEMHDTFEKLMQMSE